MTNSETRKLLRDRRVIEEIRRHLWLESEKAGHDIGFDQAAEDWLKRYAKAWMRYHLPKQKQKQKRGGRKTVRPRAKSRIKNKSQSLTRRAKRY